jgi:hypothetical protein
MPEADDRDVVLGVTLPRRWPLWLVLAGLAVYLLAVLITPFPDGYNEVQGLRSWTLADRFPPVADGLPDPDTIADYRAATGDDIVFALLYGIAGACVAVGALARRRRRAMAVAIGFFVAAAGFDVAENLFLDEALERYAGGEGLGLLPEVVRGLGAGKIAALVAGVATVLWFALAARKPGRDELDVRTIQLPKPPPGPDEADRLGICCSGGGTRSASFSLGALQALRRSGHLEQASYLAAVSGGGYIAAGLEVAESNARADPGTVTPPPPAFAPDSPETRWFRDHSSYLLPDFIRGSLAVARLVGGLVVNVLILWLVFFAVARPVGWLISELHPERQAGYPIAVPVDPEAEVTVTASSVEPLDPVEGENGEEIARWSVTVEPDGTAGFEVLPFGRHEDMTDDAPLTYEVVPGEVGIIEVEAGRASIARQPTVAVEPTGEGSPCGEDETLTSAAREDLTELVHCSLVVQRQPTLEVAEDAVLDDAADVAAQLEVADQPRLVSNSGLRGRDDITIDGWMWALVLGTAGVALGYSLVVMLLRINEPWRRWPGAVLWSIAAGLFLVLILLPWLDQELFESASRLARRLPSSEGATSSGGGWEDVLVPFGGFLALVATALGRFFVSNQGTTGGEAAKTEGSWPGRLWAKLRGRNRELGWYELSATKILAGILVFFGAVAVFVNHLQYASANGYDGRLMGTAILRDRIASQGWWPTEWQKYVLVVLVLVALQRFVDAHAGSIHSYYKQRLSEAFLLRRQGRRAGPVPYDRALPFESIPGFPDLILCCAVNLSEVGAAPPGRRAGSFTFSAREVGGPLVGYRHYDEYWREMRKARRKDVTIPSAMAISGAAFSPAMGKKNLGPVGSLFALANLRLGVWIPHPRWVGGAPPRSWYDRPGWSWFGREVLNRYQADAQYLYVSDGGHWDNLGLVELLRRGCTRIVCINAGGDGADSFGTIGEALALAREELAVEFDLDPSALRPPLVADESQRLFRRQQSRDEASPLSTVTFVRGTFRFTRDGDRRGEIWLIEPALTPDLPFDVHVYAEGEAIFPDDSTADLVYNHRQFEAFRALGYHQASQVAADLP